jgi:drug/metabolite transporter (DMT)-like permease
METNFANKISFHWAIIGLLVVSIVWGTSYGVSKQILNQLSVVELLLIRFVISCAVLLSVIYFKQQIRIFTSQWRRYLQVGISTGLILSCIFLTETWAVKLAQAGQVAVLISLCVLFTPLLETAWLKVKLPKGIMLFCSIGFAGMVMIASPSELSLDLGVGLVIIAALLRAVMVVTCRKAFTKTPLQIEIITLIQLSVVTLISFCLVLLDSDRPALISTLQTLNSHDWGSLLYLALCCTLLAFFVQNYAVKHLPASQASLLMGTEPMFGLLFASVFLSETMSILQWLGCFIVITTTIAACYKFSEQK